MIWWVVNRRNGRCGSIMGKIGMMNVYEKMGGFEMVRRGSGKVGVVVKVEESELEEGEFVVSDYDVVEGRSYVGIWEEGREVEEGEIVDEVSEMEEGEFVKPANAMEGSEPEEGEIIECDSSLAPVQLPHDSPKALLSETKVSLKLKPIGSLQVLDLEDKRNLSEGFEAESSNLTKSFNVRESFDCKEDVEVSVAKDDLNRISHPEKKESPNRAASHFSEYSVLPQNLFLKTDSGQCQASYPQGRVLAHSFCAAGSRRCNQLEYSKHRDSGHGKSSQRNRIVTANAKQSRKEVKNEDAFKEIFNQRKGVLDHVRKSSAFKYNAKDGGFKSSCGDSGMKFAEPGRAMSFKRKSSGKFVDERHVGNQRRNENKVCLGLTNKRVPERGLMATSNCPWRKRKETLQLTNKLTPDTAKSIPKNHEFVLWNTSKSVSGKRNARQDYSPGRNEGDGSCLVKRSANTNLSLTRVGLNDRDVDNGQGGDIRNKVRKALRLFQILCRVLMQDEEQKSEKPTGSSRVDLKSATILKENKKWVHYGKKMVGDVPGVEVGDEFRYRVELSIVGLHSPYQGGIDSAKIQGKRLATSIVASGSYDDYMDSSDVFIYSGQGGTPIPGSKIKKLADQKLIRGNLALKNSMDEGTPVRVVRVIEKTLIYDGLYLVEKHWMQQGSYGNMVFMFQLRRKAGQPELAIKELKKSKQPSACVSICVKDISRGKEKMPIRVVNTIDEEKPPTFQYITKMTHPLQFNLTRHQGCQCIDGCLSSMKCSCAVKNGEKIPFNYNGATVGYKPLIFECGPSCRCPPSCYNRISQHGIKFPLEIFRTIFKGWGVRSLTSIPSGRFLCEYTGELLHENDADQRVGKDEYLFDIGRDYDGHSLWEGLSDLIPSEMKSGSCETVEEAGFTIDAAEYGNVARFINHSCAPNLYAQNVLYDHHDKRMPHIMLFAAENIPPLKELTFHYNIGLDQVYDSEGHIKKKKCYCGSLQCSRRLY